MFKTIHVTIYIKWQSRCQALIVLKDGTLPWDETPFFKRMRFDIASAVTKDKLLFFGEVLP
jgi:hypothetical protein